MILKELKKGDLFTMRENSSTVWVRDIYIPSEKKFSCHKWEDINHELLMKGNRTVFAL